MPFELINWLDEDGNVTALHSGKIKALVGKKGFEAPSYSHNIIKSPGRPGAILASTSTNVRSVNIPILIQASSPPELEEIISDLRASLRPDGSGQLQWYTDNNSGRHLNCYYQGGLEGSDSRGSKYDTWAKLTLSFLALDPFFYDILETEIEYALGDSSGNDFLGDPFFPLRINPSTVFTSPTIIITGDECVYPVWLIEGPGQDIYLINNTTGKTLALTNNSGLILATGDVTKIDTQFGAKTVTDATDPTINQFSYLSKASEFWPLEPGSNALSIQVNNADVDTLVTLTYRIAYGGVSG